MKQKLEYEGVINIFVSPESKDKLFNQLQEICNESKVLSLILHTIATGSKTPCYIITVTASLMCKEPETLTIKLKNLLKVCVKEDKSTVAVLRRKVKGGSTWVVQLGFNSDGRWVTHSDCRAYEMPGGFLNTTANYHVPLLNNALDMKTFLDFSFADKAKLKAQLLAEQ